MAEQYFTSEPTSANAPVTCTFEYRGRHLEFRSDAGVFSKGELDTGTRVLLSALPGEVRGRVLDLGCGWGALGVCVGKINPDAEIVLSDVNTRAIALARDNAARNGVTVTCVVSDGFERLDGMFDQILLNPPIRAGKQTVYRLFSECADHLAENGELFIVIRKQQGAPSALEHLKTLFDHAMVVDKSGGYWVICCVGGKRA